jgi:cytoskeleton protein RodZ
MSMGIGDVLRDARRRQGVSLSDAAEVTKVRESYLAALEQEEFEALGGDVYVKGFITSYARFLALDPEPLLVTFRTHAKEREDARPPLRGSNRRPMMDMPGAESPRTVPVGAVVLLVMVVLIALVLVVLGLRGGGDAVVAVVLVPARVRSVVWMTPTTERRPPAPCGDGS